MLLGFAHEGLDRRLVGRTSDPNGEVARREAVIGSRVAPFEPCPRTRLDVVERHAAGTRKRSEGGREAVRMRRCEELLWIGAGARTAQLGLSRRLGMERIAGACDRPLPAAPAYDRRCLERRDSTGW